MQEDKYSFKKLPETFYYEFFSLGPKGEIKKVVRYRLVEEFPTPIFNLGFGDWNEHSGEMNDRITTNNNDRQKVLATVADTIFDFTKNHPGCLIFAQGSTESRTRLYQMGIAAFWEEVNSSFVVLGYYNEGWEAFEKGTNYEAFLIKRK